MSKKNYIIQKIIAVILIAFGSVWIFIGLVALFTSDSEKFFTLIGGAMIGLPPFIPGLIWFLNIRKKEKRQESESREALVLRFIKNHDGIVTTEMIAAETELNLSEAKQELELLVLKGIAFIDVNENGIIEYGVNSLLQK